MLKLATTLPLLLLAAITTTPTQAAPEPTPRPELTLLSLHLGHHPAEISGIALIHGTLHIVSDGDRDLALYEIKSLHGKRFSLAKHIRLPALSGWPAYVASQQAATVVEPKDRRADFEGLAVCGDTVYVADERVRQIAVIDLNKKSITRLGIDLPADPQLADLKSGGANAGIEGVAVDCASGTLYTEKERDPRMIIAVDLAALKVTDHFDIPLSDRGGQSVINPWTGQGLLVMSPDFADLFFADGFLYVLERNTYEIAKVDPKTHAVVARVSYYQSEKGLYETGEPFGIAEALLLTKDEIFVGLDNNGTPLGVAASKRLGVAGDVPALMRFARPAGF